MPLARRLALLALAAAGLSGCAYTPPGYYLVDGTYQYRPGAFYPLPYRDPFVPEYPYPPPPPPPPPGMAPGMAPAPGTPVPPPR